MSRRPWVALLSIALGCLLPASAVSAEPFQWKTAAPASHGMSPQKLDALRDAIAGQTRALLVIRDDHIVYEWYPEGRAAKERHSTASLAKAIVGGLSWAVARDDGLIALDDPAWKYVPAWKDDPLKSQITVRHLGSHTSGIDDSHNREEQARGVDQGSYTGWSGEFWRWRGGKQPPPNDAFSISRDVAPMLFEPGSEFQYSNPGIAMLTYCVTAALRDAPHRDIRTLLRERIMRPIGAPDDGWSCGYGKTEEVEGLPLVASWGGGSYAPRVTARIGRLVLHKGAWDGKRLLSESAVSEMVNSAGLPGHCGMGWWTNADGRYEELPRDAVWGAGAGHQILLVVPSLDLVMVRNGGELRLDDSGEKDRDRRALYERLFKPLMDAITKPATFAGKKLSANELDPQRAPYPQSKLIQGVHFDFSTHRRLAPGSDNWAMTWADDGHQYSAWGDGGGFGGTNSQGRVSLGVARIEGSGDSYSGHNVWGGNDAENPSQFEGKCYGILSVGGVLYMWVDFQPPPHLGGCQVAASTDHGATWQLADWHFSFDDDLTVPTFVNFGKDYAGARDEYVYSYYIQPQYGPGRSPTGNYGFDVHRPGLLYLSRVPKNSILERDAYEFFAGIDDNGAPKWSADLERKQPVFKDPNGVGWNVSASYSPSLRRYLLCTEHTDTHAGYLGLFEAPEPWGPWSTVEYIDNFGAGTVEVSAFYWSFPTKWLRDDGRFTMVFTGKNSNDSWNTVQGRFEISGQVTTQREASAESPRTEAPYPPSPVIAGIEWAAASAITRQAPGSDNWPLTWADDDQLYTAYGDGKGFRPFVPKKLSMGFAKVSGGPDDCRGVNILSPAAETLGDGARGQKASGILMIDDVLYLLTRNAVNAQLSWSDDYAKTWQHADWKFTTSFGCPTFLNFGRNYAGTRDDYVYLYSHDDDSAYEAADRMVLARVPKQKLRVREAYEFFTGVDSQNQPEWSADVADRGAVFQHKGRCYRGGITYNAGLGRYLWCQILPESQDRRGPRFEGGFGIYDAPEPWGPWTTVYFTEHWDVGPGETSSFPTKWISDDGLTLHLVFSGDDAFSIRQARLRPR